MTPPETSNYRDIAKRNINSPQLQKNLKELQEKLGKGLTRFWAETKDNDIRNRVKKSRTSCLNNLDLILTELAEKIEKNDGQVFFAETQKDCVDYTLEIAKKRNVKRIIKGKSMTSAEVKIDKPLQDSGIEVIETDLGEFIIQLAGDQPSHIIGPCIHMNRKDIGELFSKHLAIDYSDDPSTLTMAARRFLREKMISADMGITGCNLACAETGQISLVSNEGNIRMATTLPPVLVVFMGIERVVATLDQQRETIQLLTQSAALQKLSTYVSYLGGPTGTNEPDGPEEFHLVIIDNGRSKILGDPEFKESLECIRCGACLNICPVYGKIGGHAYKSVYSGPIGAVISPLLDGINKHADLCQGETLCGACKDICPVQIDLPRMLLALRHKLAYGSDRWNTQQDNPLQAYAFKTWKLCATNSFLYNSWIKMFRYLQRPFVGRSNLLTEKNRLYKNWTKERDLKPIADQTFREYWKKHRSGKDKLHKNEADNG